MRIELRRITTALLCVLCVAGVGGRTAIGADDALDKVKAQVVSAVDKLVLEMKRRNPHGAEFTIVAVPLIDALETRPRVIGRWVSDVVTSRLANTRPVWLNVQDRLHMPQVLEEQKLWVVDFVKEKQYSGKTPKALIRAANLLVVGTTTVVGNSIEVRLKLKDTRNGDVITSPEVSFKRDNAFSDLLYFVERDRDGRKRDVARVRKIDVEVTAQRGGKAGAVREWEVKPGETLRGGEQFNIRFIPDADAEVHIFCYGSDGEASLLFPTDAWEADFQRKFSRNLRSDDSYCFAELVCVVPGKDAKGVDLFYQLDNTPGHNELYIVAKRYEVRGIEKIRRELQRLKTTDARKDMLRNKFDYVEIFEFEQE